MVESIVDEAPASIPSRDEVFNEAQIKLRAAVAISDLVGMLHVHNAVDSLNEHTLSTTMLHVEELISEASEMFDQVQHTKEASHG